jgi:hypothetical protein
MSDTLSSNNAINTIRVRWDAAENSDESTNGIQATDAFEN